MVRVTFLGLGVMGFPMAGHLTRHGHEVGVYNRTKSKALDWQSKFGGDIFDKPASAAQGRDIIMTCLGNDDDVRGVILGDDGVLEGAQSGAVIVDHSTVSADVSCEIAEACRHKDVGFLDAPVSGGQVGAENGVLTVMVGGDVAHYAKAEPLINAFAKACQLMGPVGSGQKTKMVNQIAIAGLVQGLAEAIHFGQRAGLDVDQVVDVIGKGAAGSWQMDNRAKTMNADQFDFGFAVDWMRKDLRICLNEASKNGARLPVAALVDQFYADVQAMEGGRWDTSSLIKRLNMM